jgi:hypothetical protein
MIPGPPSSPSRAHPRTEQSLPGQLPALSSPAPSTSSLLNSDPDPPSGLDLLTPNNPNSTTTGIDAPLPSRNISNSDPTPLPLPHHSIHADSLQTDPFSLSSSSSCLNFKGGDCLVCYTSYESEGCHTPVFFQCGHSICKRCSERLQEPCPNTFAISRRKVRCPTCFTFSPFPLVKNFELINLLEANHLLGKTLTGGVGEGVISDERRNGEERVCENCDHSLAIKYCINCLVTLCQSCDELLHQSRAMQKHQRGVIPGEVSCPLYLRLSQLLSPPPGLLSSKS